MAICSHNIMPNFRKYSLRITGAKSQISILKTPIPLMGQTESLSMTTKRKVPPPRSLRFASVGMADFLQEQMPASK